MWGIVSRVTRWHGGALASALSQELTRNAAGTLALRVGFVALEFLCGLSLARVFGASGYGVYAFVLSCVGLLGIPAALGFDRLLIREVATLRAGGEWSQARGIIRRSGEIVVAASIAMAVAVAAGASVFGGGLGTQMVLALQLGMIIVPITAYARVRQAALQGLGHVVLGQLPETLVQPLALLSAVALLQLVPQWPRTGTLAVSLNLGSATLACIVGVSILRRLLPEPIRAADCEFRTGHWVRGALPFVWMLGMNVVLTYADTIIVGVLQGPASAAVYRVASQMGMLVALPLTAVNMAVAPSLAACYSRGDFTGMQQRASGAARASFFAALPVALALLILGKAVLGLFGQEFPAGYPALAILAGAYLLNASMGASGYLLIMTRYERAAAISFACAAAINVCGNLLLVPVWGTAGAAVATAVSVAFVSIVFAILAYHKLGIRACVSLRGTGGDLEIR